MIVAEFALSRRERLLMGQTHKVEDKLKESKEALQSMTGPEADRYRLELQLQLVKKHTDVLSKVFFESIWLWPYHNAKETIQSLSDEEREALDVQIELARRDLAFYRSANVLREMGIKDLRDKEDAIWPLICLSHLLVAAHS